MDFEYLRGSPFPPVGLSPAEVVVLFAIGAVENPSPARIPYIADVAESIAEDIAETDDLEEFEINQQICLDAATSLVSKGYLSLINMKANYGSGPTVYKVTKQGEFFIQEHSVAAATEEDQI